MAVDTRDKRFSMIGFGPSGQFATPNPNGANMDTGAERAMMLHLYYGISISSGQPTERRWGGVPHMRLYRTPFGRSW
jgi:hypothetical protein